MYVIIYMVIFIITVITKKSRIFEMQFPFSGFSVATYWAEIFT